ncbi:cytochrome P450 716B1 isoform X2 [Cryptomeria japonica]|uniref:cytochrome P450 716B1 isoform X2 n=1 Tax=Cryptomeria japonica TaxID=3369 RepID=UPI0027D9F24D|nr:cytochrome P450 716B1 isoform X2 [Cryptomeria japonica]
MAMMKWVGDGYDAVKPIPLTLLMGFLLSLIGLLINMKRKAGGKIPPGKFGWPFLGETLEFLKWQKKGAPFVFYDTRVQKYGEIFTTHLVGHPTVTFFSADGNKFLFTNENKLVQNSWPASVGKLFERSVINAVGDDAKRLKGLLMTFLRPEALQKFTGRVDSITRRHLAQYWLGEEEVTVFPLMKIYTFSLACQLFASIEDGPAMDKLSHDFEQLAQGVLQVPVDLPGTRYHKARVARDALREQLTQIIEERRIALRNGRASAEQDLLSFLLCNRSDDEERSLTDDEIKDNIILLLYAGHDTSSSALTSLFKFLAENPHCYDQVLQEQLKVASSKEEGELLEWKDLQRMKYTWRVVQETLRLLPPAQGGFRKAIKDFTYSGFTIPKGWKAYWTVNATHFNSKYFINPKKFDPSRFEGAGPAPYTFVPFGGGLRICPGNEFARVEILVFLHNVLKNFRWNLVDPDEKIIIDPMPLPLKGLPIKLIPHSK